MGVKRPQRIAVITMAMRRDFPHAHASLAMLAPQLNADTRHFLLWNDEPDDSLTAPYADSPNHQLDIAGENLGVAGGRNRLIESALEWGADLIVAFDDDLVPPSDYLDRLAWQWARLDARYGPVGVIAPVIVDYHAAREILFRESEALKLEKGEPIGTRPTDEYRAVLRRAASAREEGLPGELFFHMGIRDWVLHYLGGHSGAYRRWRAGLERAVGLPAARDWNNTMLRTSPAARAQPLKPDTHALPVDTLPGGVSVYSRALVEAIGPTEPAFGPFGFEDSEFSVRALQHGYKNFILPGELVVHDFQSRLLTRDRRITCATRGKMRSLLLRRRVEPADWIPAAVDAWALGLGDLVSTFRSVRDRESLLPGELVRWIVSYYAGLVVGLLRPVLADEPHEPNEADGTVVARLERWLSRLDPSARITSESGEVGPAHARLAGVRFSSARGSVSAARIEITSPSQPDPAGVPRSGSIALTNLVRDGSGAQPIDLSLEWSLDRGVVRLASLRLRIGELGTVHAALELAGLDESTRPETDIEGVSIVSARAELHDAGLVAGLFGDVKVPGDGRLSTLLRHGLSGTADEPARVRVSLAPESPVPMSALRDVGTAEALMDTLGFSVGVEHVPSREPTAAETAERGSHA